MKTSARNYLTGTVASITTGAVNDEVELALDGGQRVVATVTRGSTSGLGLAVGQAAFALVKASSVIVVTELGTARLSARNQLAGTVAAVVPGAVNAEVVVDIGGGAQVAAIVTQASAGALGLAAGMPGDGDLQGLERDPRRRRLTATSTSRPAPKSATVSGSGTGAATAWWTSRPIRFETHRPRCVSPGTTRRAKLLAPRPCPFIEYAIRSGWFPKSVLSSPSEKSVR